MRGAATTGGEATSSSTDVRRANQLTRACVRQSAGFYAEVRNDRDMTQMERESASRDGVPVMMDIPLRHGEAHAPWYCCAHPETNASDGLPADRRAVHRYRGVHMRPVDLQAGEAVQMYSKSIVLGEKEERVFLEIAERNRLRGKDTVTLLNSHHFPLVHSPEVCLRACVCERAVSVCVCSSVCMRLCVSACTLARIFVFVCMDACSIVCIYTHAHAHAQVYTAIRDATNGKMHPAIQVCEICDPSHHIYKFQVYQDWSRPVLGLSKANEL